MHGGFCQGGSSLIHAVGIAISILKILIAGG